MVTLSKKTESCTAAHNQESVNVTGASAHSRQRVIYHVNCQKERKPHAHTAEKAGTLVVVFWLESLVGSTLCRRHSKYYVSGDAGRGQHHSAKESAEHRRFGSSW
jgi:hypothetical protein